MEKPRSGSEREDGVSDAARLATPAASLCRFMLPPRPSASIAHAEILRFPARFKKPRPTTVRDGALMWGVDYLEYHVADVAAFARFAGDLRIV
jgi:hypothetical protein